MFYNYLMIATNYFRYLWDILSGLNVFETVSQQTQNICTTFVQRRAERLRRWSNIAQM